MTDELAREDLRTAIARFRRDLGRLHLKPVAIVLEDQQGRQRHAVLSCMDRSDLLVAIPGQPRDPAWVGSVDGMDFYEGLPRDPYVPPRRGGYR